MRKHRIYKGVDRPTKEEMDKLLDECAKDGTGVLVCPFGHHCRYHHQTWECWRNGCYDTPVYDYIEIDNEEFN